MEGNVAQNKTNACRSPTPCLNKRSRISPPGNTTSQQTDRQTDGHKSRSRLYIDRGKRLGRVDSGKTAIVVKNGVLPRWRSAAIIGFGFCDMQLKLSMPR